MPSRGVIRPARPGDIKGILSIEQKCFPDHLAYTRRQYWYLLTKAHRTFLVETQGKQLRGFIVILYRKGTTVAGLETIDVDPDFQHHHIASRLLQAAEQQAKKKGMNTMRLEVSVTNRPALALYNKHHYQKVAVLKNYYLYPHDGSTDVFRMSKSLI